MKFGKEFRAQMVPEWQEAYVNYDSLKILLKELQRFKIKNNPPKSTRSLKRNLTMYSTFRGLTAKEINISSPRVSVSSPRSPVRDIENQAIVIDSVSRDGSQSYETTFLMICDEGSEYERTYFRCLDKEFNKVEKFYKEKVDEVMTDAEMLNKQMDALIAFRIKVDNPFSWNNDDESSAHMTRLASDVAASAAALAASTPSSARASRRVDAFDENSSQDEKLDESNHSKEGKHMINIGGIQLAPLEILNHVKVNSTPETPISTIKGLLKVDQQTKLKFTRENLRRVEQQLKRAFVAFYRKFALIKSFSFLNTLAFLKIMKKYDKISERNASKDYMKTVDKSFLGNSDEVTRLMERVEATFIKHFCNSNRSKGMRTLRPKVKKERHITTFSMGLFFGCAAALIIALCLLIHARDILSKPGREAYMRTLFPLYSLFWFIVLHLLMYAANIYFWRRYRVNYSFIFGFKQGTELGYRQVMLVSFGIAVLALLCVLANLDMEMDPETEDYIQYTELLPFCLLVFLLLLLLLPLNILYRSSRFFFLTCIFHCIAAPLYKVALPDFFLADQLTSQVQAFRSLEFYICYYGWGNYKLRENTCKSSDIFNTFYYIVAAIPYWVRLLQCLRRLFEEKEIKEGFNGGKYLVTIIAISLRTAHSLNVVNNETNWRVVAWISSIIAAIYGTYWDIVFDWGLFQCNSKNRFLRDRLLIPRKTVYYIAMVLNMLLRLAWLQTVLNFTIFTLHMETSIAVFASLEIIRRGIWNFFRLENEHLNNVGKFRAFKSVPLPFNYEEDDDKDGLDSF